MTVRSRQALIAAAVSVAMASVYSARVRAETTTAAFAIFDFKNYTTSFNFSGGSPPSTILPTNALAGDSRFGSSLGLGTAYSTYLTTDYTQVNVPTGVTGPTPGAFDASPGRSTFGNGTVRTLGMSNNFAWGASTSSVIPNSSTSTPDIAATTLNTAPGTPSVPTFRARGLAPSNGWSQQAPQYTQGVEFDVPKQGWTDLSVSLNWFSTTQGIRNMQVLYSVDNGTTFQKLQGSYNGTSGTTFRTSWSDSATGVTNFPYGYLTVTNPNNFQPQITLDFSGLTNVNTASTLEVRLVSAYARANPAVDGPSSWLKVLGPGGTAAQQTGGLDLGTGATVTGAATNAYNFTPIGQPLYLGGTALDPAYGKGGYNNNSGNWRFTNFVVTGSTTNAVSGGTFNPNALDYTWAPQAGSTVLNTSATNFTKQGASGNFAFATNNNLVFGNTGVGTVVATGANVVANSISVTNTSGTYVFNSDPGVSLSGFATLIKSGAGTLQLRPKPASGVDNGTGTNLFGGGVVVNAGTLRYWADSALGGGALTVGVGGTVQVSSPLAAGVQYTTTGASRDLTIGSAPPVTSGNTTGASGVGAAFQSNLNVDSNVTVSFGGAVQAADPTWYNRMVKTGGGLLDLQAPTFFSPSGIQLGVTSGELRVGLPSGIMNVWVAPEWGTATAGNLTITGNTKLSFVRTDRADGNFNGNDVFSPGTVGATGGVTGTITFTGVANPQQNLVPGIVASHATNVNTGGNSAIWSYAGQETVLNMPVKLAATNGTNAVTGKFLFGADARNNTTWDTLDINATIFGNGNVYFATTTTHDTGYPYQISGGNGLVNINTVLTYVGDTYIALNNAGAVRINLDNPLPTGTRLAFGDDLVAPSLDVGALDLNGHTLTVGSVDGGPRPKDPNLPKGTYAGIVNNSDTTATLVLSGSASSTYTGQIGKLAVNGQGTTYNYIVNNPNTSINIFTTPTFSGTQTFSGSLAMTGTVLARTGKIVLSSWDGKANDAAKASNISALNSGVVELNPNNSSTAYALAARVSLVAAHNGGTVAMALTNRLAGKLPSVLVPDAISISGGSGGFDGFIDLSNNDMILPHGDESLLRSAVSTWYNGGSQISTGLGSTAATAGPGTTLAVFKNVDLSDTGGFYTSYDGLALNTDDVIVKYTYFGDTNLDGVVNGTDLSNLIEGLSTDSTGWRNGDLDYSGNVDATDFALYLQGLAAYQAGGTLGDGQFTVPTGPGVPEPTSLALAGAALPLVTRRRRVGK